MGKHIDQYMHRTVCQILVASPSAAGAKSDSAEKKFRPPPPIGWESPKSCYYFSRNSTPSANSHWRAEGVARRANARPPPSFFPPPILCPLGKRGRPARAVRL